MTVELEDRIRHVLARQAQALPAPDWHPSMAPVRGPWPERSGPDRRALWLATAAAALVVVGGLALVARARMTDTGPAAPPTAAQFQTVQVALAADAITVEAGGLLYTPTNPTLEIHSDPGDASYTTLELAWMEHNREMRINVYFASDGADWWVDEIRTYDGSSPADWVIQTGEWFRSSLDAAYEAPDVVIGPLHISGLRLQAFLPAVAGCQSQAVTTIGPPSTVQAQARSVQLVAETDSITMDTLAGAGYALNVALFDTDTCAQITPADADLDLSVTIDDPTAFPGTVNIDNDGRIELSNNGVTGTPGRTVLRIIATRTGSGEVAAEIGVPVVLRSYDG